MVIPLLKYVRGDSFSDKHWVEMYNILGIPSGIAVDVLTFGELLKVGKFLSKSYL